MVFELRSAGAQSRPLLTVHRGDSLRSLVFELCSAAPLAAIAALRAGPAGRASHGLIGVTEPILGRLAQEDLNANGVAQQVRGRAPPSLRRGERTACVARTTASEARRAAARRCAASVVGLRRRAGAGAALGRIESARVRAHAGRGGVRRLVERSARAGARVCVGAARVRSHRRRGRACRPLARGVHGVHSPSIPERVARRQRRLRPLRAQRANPRTRPESWQGCGAALLG